MPFPTFSLTVDALSRTVSYRSPGGSLTTARIWCHGGGSNGENFLNKVLSVAGVIDYGPHALSVTDPPNLWVIPGGTYPPAVPNSLTDVRFIDALVARIKADHPGIQIVMGGFSSGAKMTWHAYGYNADPEFVQLQDVEAFAFGSGCEPTTYDWDARTKHARPCAYWYGTVEPDPGGNEEKTFAASLADLYAEAGVTTNSNWVNLGNCCGNKTLRRKKSTNGLATWHYQRVGGGHDWTDCSACHEDTHFQEFFASL